MKLKNVLKIAFIFLSILNFFYVTHDVKLFSVLRVENEAVYFWPHYFSVRNVIWWTQKVLNSITVNALSRKQKYNSYNEPCVKENTVLLVVRSKLLLKWVLFRIGWKLKCILDVCTNFRKNYISTSSLQFCNVKWYQVLPIKVCNVKSWKHQILFNATTTFQHFIFIIYYQQYFLNCNNKNVSLKFIIIGYA